MQRNQPEPSLPPFTCRKISSGGHQVSLRGEKPHLALVCDKPGELEALAWAVRFKPHAGASSHVELGQGDQEMA